MGKIKKLNIKKYDDIIDNIQEELDEFQAYQFIMRLFNDLLAFLGTCFDSVESERQYYELLKAYNIMMKICEENGGLEDNSMLEVENLENKMDVCVYGKEELLELKALKEEA